MANHSQGFEGEEEEEILKGFERVNLNGFEEFKSF